MKILFKNKITPVSVMPGDTVNLYHAKVGPDGKTVSRTLVASHQVTKAMTNLDTAIIFEIENEMGLKTGIGGVLGK